MPRTKKKPQPAPTTPQPAAVNVPPSDVLTLAEAAAYLRLSEQDVMTLVHSQGLPGRCLAGEWRFLKTAIQQWLATAEPTLETRKAAQLAIAGTLKDDPYLEDMLEEIYRARGRPITEDGSYRLFHGLKPENERK
jgi:excisionase family DNA binding protein